MDPFYHRDAEAMWYDDQEFQTARLNVEVDAYRSAGVITVEDYEGYAEPSDDEVVEDGTEDDIVEDGSFDDSDQMNRFLNSIKGDRKRKRKENKGRKEIKQDHVDDFTDEKVESKLSQQLKAISKDKLIIGELEVRDQQPQLQIENETLEMIQEETEQDTTKLRESALITPERARSNSEPLVPEKDFNNTTEYKCDQLEYDNNTTFENRKEELMHKVLHSAYSSMSSFKTNLMESLELNKSKDFMLYILGELQELEAMGIDALSIIKRIMKEFEHVFKARNRANKNII